MKDKTINTLLEDARQMLAVMQKHQGSTSAWYALLDQVYELLRSADEKKATLALAVARKVNP